MEDSQQASTESYCEDVSDSDSELDECIEDEQDTQDDSMARSRTDLEGQGRARTQIRNNISTGSYRG